MSLKLTHNILVVDDDMDMLRMLDLSLSKSGHKIATASNWEEVIGHINTIAKSKKMFDAIVLDLMMPERSGYDILRSLSVILHPLPPVIILTALSGIDDAVKALELGAAKYLTKPVTTEKLLTSIREVIRGGGSRF